MIYWLAESPRKILFSQSICFVQADNATCTTSTEIGVIIEGHLDVPSSRALLTLTKCPVAEPLLSLHQAQSVPAKERSPKEQLLLFR